MKSSFYWIDFHVMILCKTWEKYPGCGKQYFVCGCMYQWNWHVPSKCVITFNVKCFISIGFSRYFYFLVLFIFCLQLLSEEKALELEPWMKITFSLFLCLLLCLDLTFKVSSSVLVSLQKLPSYKNEKWL